MEDFFGLHPSVVAYSDHHHHHHHQNVSMSSSSSENLVVSATDYQNLLMSSSVSAFRDHRIPIFGSDHHHHHHHQFLSAGATTLSESTTASIAPAIHGAGDHEITSEIKAKIASHPRYPTLLQAYIDCQKVGAPPEIACLLDEIRQESDVCKRSAVSSRLGVDPELDDFMETYCDMLIKYKSDLARPFDEATTFLNKIEMQLTTLCNKPLSRNSASDEVAGSSDEEFSGGEVEIQDFQTRVEDRDLKDKLLRKYSGYISSLKQEFSKKKKKGKLPKEARQTLLDWWTRHYKWPYPTEADKIALAEATSLDQKQINNWFINQRKRHWKPSENMQYAIMDSLSAPFFIDD